ncbi:MULTISPECIES: hypothetical protein [Paraburkholderia]|uniref:Uncharacterized protein n=1 Tax=Paraburkholderia madseniana TaxID=2599607 RepID=A0AAP5BNC2_9BURK|nr:MULTISPECIES: hypothetical protein [Paraburkholderia]MCX4151976.1 hypothetical protein [Paraburkholderia madseniana]MCX4175605.1 hypothetical protein [Paraburkholderia madseniana]MDN7154904.1 hypothetical protein [Paraburkholderia sp. WS6]MDQ6413787.1 hypothetical protein [Paraburkholderia madseniana]MDQ6463601.1 hypothetical protein [Paraburkholderia madseniana]
MERTFEQTVSDLRMLLRDQPPSTTADVADGAVLYLAGNELRGVFLNADEPDGLDQPFAVDQWFVGQLEENLEDWFHQPRFTLRPSLQTWALDAPPAEPAD